MKIIIVLLVLLGLILCFKLINKSEKLINNTDTKQVISEYLSCGCGCCGDTNPMEECLYLSRGDDINEYIEKDKNIASSSQCATVGCSAGTIYKYCD